jgi:hypothetical protein
MLFTYEEQIIMLSRMDIVKQNGHAIQYIHDQTPELCMEAVKQNAYAIWFIRKQTPKLCMITL